MPVEWTPEKSLEAMRAGALRGTIMAANVVRDEVLRLILHTAKTGREYRRRGVTHIASAPGEPPASDTGNLVRSITVEVDAPNTKATVNAGAEYAGFLEFGTPTMEPRPYMRLALDNKTAEIEEIIAREVSKELSQ